MRRRTIECDTAEHSQAKVLVWAAVFAYPVGLMALNAILLYVAHGAIIDGKGSAFEMRLARSIAFLYKEYDVTCFWWEIAEMMRKFLLVGLFVCIEPGSITQIAMATIVTAVYLLVQLNAKPFKNPADDFLAASASFALLMLFFCSVIYKYIALTDQTAQWMS